MSTSLVSGTISEVHSCCSTQLPSAYFSFVDRAINGHSLWSTNGGPPLILVILAAGALVGAIVCLFLLRRLHARRERLHPHRDVYQNLRLYFEDDRPQLWDVYITECMNAYDIDRLHDIMPISAILISPRTPSAEKDNTGAHRLVQQFVLFMQRMMNSESRSGSHMSSWVNDDDLRNIQAEADEGQLEIAVAICMPTQSNHTQSHCEDMETTSIPEYCVGVATYTFKDKPP